MVSYFFTHGTTCISAQSVNEIIYTHLLLVSSISCWFNDGRYTDYNKRRPITSDEKVEGPNGGVEHKDHHAVQLHSF